MNEPTDPTSDETRPDQQSGADSAADARAVVASFFGHAESLAYADDRPELLLGLEYGESSPADVTAALQRRLAFINLHPLRDTAEAQRMQQLVRQAATRMLLGDGPRAARIVARASVPMAAAPPFIRPVVQRAEPLPAFEQSGAIPLAEAKARDVPEREQRDGSQPDRVQPEVPQPARTVAAPARPSGAVLPPAVLAQVRAMFAASGRLDQATLTKLTVLSAQSGIPLRALIEAIAGPSEGGAARQSNAGATMTAGYASAGAAVSIDEERSSSTVKRVILVVAGLAVMLAIGLGVIVTVVLSKSKLLAPAPAAGAAPVATGAGAAADANVPATSASDERLVAAPSGKPASAGPSSGKPIDGAKLLATLRDVPATGDGAVDGFGRALSDFGDNWTRVDGPTRTAAIEAAVDGVLRLERAGRGQEVAALLAQGPKAKAPLTGPELSRLALRSGLIARIVRESELRPPMREALRSAWQQLHGADVALGAGFVPGVTAVLRSAPLRLLNVDDVEAGVGVYIEIAVAISSPTQSVDREKDLAAAESQTGSDATKSATLLLLDGLGQILVNAAEPTADRAVFLAVGKLAGAIRWRANDGSRERLLAWFDDPKCSIADLATLTGAIARSSSAEGIDGSMVVSVAASPEQRADTRRIFAETWGLIASTAIGVGERSLDDVVNTARSIAGAASSSRSDLGATIVLATASRAAWARYLGIPSGVVTIPQLPMGVVPAGQVVAPPGPASGGPGTFTVTINRTGSTQVSEGSWALRYLTERSRELRLDRLREAEQASQLDALSAEIVADAATRDGGGEIRIAASRVVLKHANEPLVVAGLLRALPRAARTKALAELVTAVSTRGIPPAGSERFAVEARRALLERLLELLGAITDADVDRQARRLAEEYWLLIPDGSETQITDENSGEQAVMASGRVYDMVLGRARQVLPGQTAPISLETVERRHTARMSASLGLIQRFAADQIGTAEALAYLVACERPANAPAAGRVLERLAERRRSGGPESASHIFTQLKHTQDAILDLMLLLTKDGRS